MNPPGGRPVGPTGAAVTGGPLDVAALERLFEYFAVHECHDDPSYVALCRLIAADSNRLALLRHAPATQRTPN